MARKGLRNLIRRETNVNGYSSWELQTLDGAPVESFSVFCAKNFEYAHATQKRYAEAVSRFLDYLFEAQVLSGAVSARYLNDVINAYPVLLRDGSSILSSRIRRNSSGASENTWLARVAENLDWKPLSSNSLSNTLAPINRFLRISEALAREARERAHVFGVDIKLSQSRFIEALDGVVELGWREVAAIKQNSLLGNVAKFAPKGIERTRRMRGAAGQGQVDRKLLDFPLEALPRLIQAANSWRDKALWLLLAASGIRMSEARNLLVQDIDLVAQQVYVFDPSGRRSMLNASDKANHRFKGRAMALTYLFSPLREQFFEALSQYLQYEFVPCSKPGEPQYLFQCIEPTRRGVPLVRVSDSAVAQSFKKALKAAAVPVPLGARDWTLHSLRHLYGVYMVNDFPVNPNRGEFGLQLVEVQMLMGHKSIRSTAHYARTKQRRLALKLQSSDEAMLGLSSGEAANLPSGVLLRIGSADD